MKALVYTAARELEFRDEPEPQAAGEGGEALVSVEAVGICGSDMHAYLGHDPRRVPPLILGHEAVGTVLEGSRSGQAVLLNPLITCGRCAECLSGRQNLCGRRELIGMVRPGAFAERVAIPESNLIPLPDGISIEKAALTEPGATALHAVALAEKSLARPVSEARVLVFGAGAVGLLNALILLDKGASEVHIADINALRRETASAATADIADTADISATGNRRCRVFDPQAAPPEVETYDAVFDAVGNTATRRAAVACVRSGGVIVHIGLLEAEGGLDARALTLREITLIGCYTYTPTDLQNTLDKIHSGALGALDWLEQRPLADGARAFKDLLAGVCPAAKIVLTV